MRLIAIAGLVLLSTGLLAQTKSAKAASPESVQQSNRFQTTYRGKSLSFYVQQAQTGTVSADTIRAIGSFRSDAVSALPELTSALQNSDVQIRIAAAWAISQIAPAHDASTVQSLAKAMSDSSPQVRTLAAVALRQIGPSATEAVPALIMGLKDSSAFVRAPSADALGAIGPSAQAAVQPLADRLQVKDEQIFVLRSVAYALGNIGPNARPALPALQEALKIVRVVYAAQEAIAKITGQALETY